MQTILISGGSGLIGSHLIPKLISKGYSVRVLSRTNKGITGCEVFKWDIQEGTIEDGALENVDHIIHLSGSSVSKGRWTRSRKHEMHDSRVKSAQLILNKLPKNALKTFVSASGVSIYGVKTNEIIFTEDSPIHHDKDDFLAQLTVVWERAALDFNQNSDRIVILRTPIVLTSKGGALEKMSKAIKMGIGSALGSGKQWMPWIHIDDICEAYIQAIEDNTMHGIYNATAPNHLTNSEFTEAIASVHNKKIWAPKVPAFVLKLLFGEMARIILNGCRVSGEKLAQTSFEYQFKKLDKALENLANK